MTQNTLQLLNLALPILLNVYRQVRDANPREPALTDDQIIALLSVDSEHLTETVTEWLSSHRDHVDGPSSYGGTD